MHRGNKVLQWGGPWLKGCALMESSHAKHLQGKLREHVSVVHLQLARQIPNMSLYLFMQAQIEAMQLSLRCRAPCCQVGAK